jgi:hypothetical protein
MTTLNVGVGCLLDDCDKGYTEGDTDEEACWMRIGFVLICFDTVGMVAIRSATEPGEGKSNAERLPER